jgi:hypothetical protein
VNGDVPRAVAAGVAGTCALSVLTALEARLRGQPAIYDPAAMAGRLSRRWLDLELGVQERKIVGALLRWSYGAGWGMVLGRVRPAWSLPWTALALGSSIWLFELLALPLSGATPASSRWPREEVWSDLANTSAYALVTAATLSLLAGGRGRGPRA